LQIIEEIGIENTILVTSYYANSQIKDKAIQLKVKILPKQMVSVVPIEVDSKHRMFRPGLIKKWLKTMH